jgi:nucleoside-diphosphate-sugar epimerase
MGFSHVIPELFFKFKKMCGPISVFSPNHTRAFCYIDDAINLISKSCFKKKSKGSVFNIGNMNEEIKIIDLAKKIRVILKSNKKIIPKKNTIGSPGRRVPDTTKIMKITNLKKFTNIDQGLKKTLNWYEKNN